MSEHDQVTTTRPAAPPPELFGCAGLTRFNKPCANRVRVEGGFCGRCHGSRLAPTPAPTGRADPPDPPDAEAARRPSAGANDWTIANELIARLTPVAGGDAELLALVEVGARLAENSRASNTKASYQQHWHTFTTFGETHGLSTELPAEPEVIGYFVAYLASAGRTDRRTGGRTGEPLSHGYISQALGAIGHRHTINGHPNPTDDPIVRGILEGYAKLHGTDVDGKDPIHGHHVAQIAETLNQPQPTSARDLAICLLATHPDHLLGASTIVGLDGTHVQLSDNPNDPMVLLVGRRGTRALTPIEIPPETDSSICPVGAMRALGPEPFGPVFRSAPDQRLSRNGLIWILHNAIDQTDIHPAAPTGGLPRLSAADRSRLSTQLTAGPAIDIRDRALITNLYWGCFRASELIERTWNQARFVDQGIEWKIPKTKTDQHGAQPRTTGVPRHPDPWLCPALALQEWRTTLERLLGRRLTPTDPIFPTLDRRTRLTIPMSVDAANDAVKRATGRIGLTGDFGSHSLRTGFTTDAIDAGAPREHVQHHGGWKNAKSLDNYIRKSSTWGDTNPALHLVQATN